jgi:serine/threonine protein kinase
MLLGAVHLSPAFCLTVWLFVVVLVLLAENEKIITKTHGTITHMAPEGRKRQAERRGVGGWGGGLPGGWRHGAAELDGRCRTAWYCLDPAVSRLLKILTPEILLGKPGVAAVMRQCCHCRSSKNKTAASVACPASCLLVLTVGCTFRPASHINCVSSSCLCAVITEATHSKAADVYSFGVVLFELVSCLKPYVGMHYAQIVASITSGKLLQLLPERASHLSPGLTDLMAACLASDPAQRPTFQQVHAKLQELEQQLRQDPQEQALLQQGPCPQQLPFARAAWPQQQQVLPLQGSQASGAAAAAAAAAMSAAASVAGSSVGGEGKALMDVIAAAQQQQLPPGVVSG